ncbi:hypothetical protein [Thiohalomonas denitrificans]|uniref:PilZ domain-containing protein n=1 Tax=Thiohalomonas denitrificans TaxID=415747 RepID=A0A1G5PIP2_9GAMM|nr:hypothetical protein [Thiohalomonas denitrificans]SCZ49383.1 hypothetical protein SAMN03097708_00141 [Thiohalomonas denitrificans]
MQQAAVELCRSAGVKSARQWLEQLPLAEPDNCIERMTEVFTCLNTVALTPKRRLQILEVLRDPVDVLLPQWVARCGTPEFPLAPHARQRFEQISSLLQNFNAGYLKAAQEKRSLFDFGTRRLNALALQHYFHYSNWLLFFHRVTGRPAPEGLWRQLHIMYRWAQNQRLADRIVDDPQPGYRKGSVTHAYYRLLLTALAPVNEFDTRWWEPLLNSIGLWSRTLRLTESTGGEQGRYFVEWDADEPPRPTRPDMQSGWYLNTDDLARDLHDRLGHSKREITVRLPKGAFTLPRHVVQRFHDQWCQIPARHSLRHQARQIVPMVFGLGALHNLLSYDADPEAGSDCEKDSAPSDTLQLEAIQQRHALKPGELGTSREERHDVWDAIYAPAAPETDSHTLPSGHWAETHANKASYRILDGRTENISSGGVCLSLPIESTQGLRVGTLIGLQSPSGRWRAGLICWLTESGQRLRFGIRNLAFRCLPVTIVVLRDGKPVTRLGALAGRNRNHSPIVILPSLHSLDENTLLVEFGGKPKRVAIKAVVFESERYLAVDVPGLEADLPPA